MTDTAGVTLEELRLATRNHGMPLEALAYDVTPLGLHYVLTHYDIPMLDASDWRLTIDGGGGHRLEMSLDELRTMPAQTRRVTMECAGNGRALLDPRPLSQPWLHEAVSTGEWTGVALAEVLARVELSPDAVELVFTGADRGVEQGVAEVYERSLPVAVASGPDALLAYRLNGAPLPPQHGFPLRLVVAGWYGMTNVKWLTRITAVDVPFAGYQQATSYRLRREDAEVGEPVTRLLPRALMVPPGIPDFLSRVRHVDAGDHRLAGRAWSGFGPVTEVAVSTDHGVTWTRGDLEPPATDPDSWQGWGCLWHATTGEHELWCRATDSAGNSQPIEASWNLGGYVNNSVQRVPVVVT